MTRQQSRAYERAVRKMKGELAEVKPEIKLALFGLAVLHKMFNEDWWEDERWWELSEEGIKFGVFIDRVPTAHDQEHCDLPDWDGKSTMRFLPEWVREELKAYPKENE